MNTWTSVQAQWASRLQALPLEPRVVEDLVEQARLLLDAHARHFHGAQAEVQASTRVQHSAVGAWPRVEEARLHARVHGDVAGEAHAEFVEWNPRDGSTWKLRARLWVPGISVPVEVSVQDNVPGNVELCFQPEHDAARGRMLQLVTAPSA